MQDTIERLITVNAPIERVFKAITDPAELVAWFPDGIEGEVSAGARPIFDFGEYGKSQIYIVAKDEPSYFAYRWVPGASTIDQPGASDVLAVPNTLVEFRLEPSGTGTSVRLIESGFAALPKEMGESSLKDNSSGWDYMLDRLGKLFSE